VSLFGQQVMLAQEQERLVQEQVRLEQEQESWSESLADCSRTGCSSQPLAVVAATEIHDLDCLLVVQAGTSETKGWTAVAVQAEMPGSRILVGGSSCFQHLLS